MFNTPVFAAAAKKKATSATRWIDMVEEEKSSTTAEATPDDAISATPDDATAVSDDDKVTHSSDASRMSKSRTAATRGSNRKALKRAAYLESSKAKTLASGGTWVDPTEHKALTSERNVLMETARSVADANNMDTEELMMYVKEIDHFFAPQFVAKARTAESVASVKDRYLTMRDGSRFCLLCKKWDTGNHTESAWHQARVEEVACADEMIGICSTSRRHEGTPGMTWPLTTKNFRKFWGEEITNMPALLRDKLRAGSTIEVQMPSMGKKAKRLLKLDDIRSVGLGAVSYPGQGKYKPYADVPERCVRWDWMEELAQEQGEDTAFVPNTPIPPNSGWWPVCIISWDTEHTDHGYASREAYYTAVINGTLTVYILCWYKLMDGTILITAWPVFLASRSLL